MLRIAKPYAFVTLGIVLLAAACVVAAEPNATSTKPDPASPKDSAEASAFKMNKMLGRGVNIGNALEAPTEGAWGVVIKEEYFDIIKQAGFNSIRLPACWTAHALTEKPYTINPDFFKRVDEVVGYAISRKMPIIVNMHNYRELYTAPLPQKERFMAIWKQIAEHYKDFSDLLLFEIYNEPDDALTPQLWNQWLKEAIDIIRQTNPNRIIVIDAANDSWIMYLKLLELPENDRNLIVTVHHYFPHALTHQGANWITRAKADQALIDMKVVNQNPASDGGDYNNWPGTKWTGTPEEKKLMTDIFDFGAAWGKEHNRPINLGEFGVYEKADMDSRIAWTRFICDTAVERGMSIHYWEFCAVFGLYDPQKKEWRKPLLDALVPPQK
jgi:endoglucanase